MPLYSLLLKSTMAYVLISQLSLGDTGAKICARISRLWDFCDMNDDTKIIHTNMVLLDQKGASIHVQVYPPTAQKLRSMLAEGKVYYIDSFCVKHANRTYRPVGNDLMVSLTKWTTFEECLHVPDDFPGITFSLTPFEDVSSLADKNIFYVDVMGVITEIGDATVVWPKSRNVDSLKRTLHICDTSNSTLPVTLWGERATAFDAENIYKAGQTERQVIIFVGTLVKHYRGIGLTITRSAPCKWYINLNVPEVLDLKQSFTTNFQPIRWTDGAQPGYEQENPQPKTIEEILAINPHKNKGARYIVNVTVKTISTDNSWWYNSCDICYRTCKPYGSSYKCTGCFAIGLPVARYKIVLTAADDTGSTNFILFGKTAQHLIRRPVESLIEENPPDRDFLPDEILRLIDQSFAWNVSYTQEALRRNQESLQIHHPLLSPSINK
ncbi:replication protein A 70 kDa DNA-binding subunit D-like [Oryza brachyantha]|uniref:replication protein A 70 kDa DNA-binding subunit D-like n=1 Tax=Oryza brachyantha TaxID=4533 RepID=UPI001ADB2461|nr:replication protein A 70 kDa DNA-binding subunit D-like [Oryza brachyantha]